MGINHRKKKERKKEKKKVRQRRKERHPEGKEKILVNEAKPQKHTHQELISNLLVILLLCLFQTLFCSKKTENKKEKRLILI
jgi:hypothetical protein